MTADKRRLDIWLDIKAQQVLIMDWAEMGWQTSKAE